jgi:hypothetical protein
MAMSDPYEEWKSQGRPGGSFENWMASQATGAPAPAGQDQQTTTTPSNPSQGGGSKFNWTPNASAAQKAWENAGRPPTPNVNEWFKNAVEAGIYLTNGESPVDTAYNKSGFSSNNNSPDITGMRAWAKAHGMSEDFDRWDEGQLMSWEKQKDANCPPNTPYQAFDGSGCIEKPIDSNKTGPAQTQSGYSQGGQGGQGGGGYAPSKPIGFGTQLSTTGNPLQDMLISQFNTGKGNTAEQGFNIFGLGEDRAVGGTGVNADKGVATGKELPVAQSLSGGGLWWGAGKDAFKGFDASKKNSNKAASISPAAPATPANVAAQAPAALPNAIPAAFRGGGVELDPRRRKNLMNQSGGISGMMVNQFGAGGQANGQPPRFF